MAKYTHAQINALRTILCFVVEQIKNIPDYSDDVIILAQMQLALQRKLFNLTGGVR